jgi:hypothetical protein
MNWKYLIPFYGLYVVAISNEEKKGKWIAISLFITLVTYEVIGNSKQNNQVVQQPTTTVKESSVTYEPEQENKKQVGRIGEAFRTDYFEIMVKSYSISSTVYTGNRFADLKRDPGNQYLIIDVIYKNIDRESRMIGGSGTVYLRTPDNVYEFDKSESVLKDGYGIFLGQINPMVQKSTKLVFKVPENFKGEVFWSPSRSDEFIFFGEVK